jgi:hypothetical protein
LAAGTNLITSFGFGALGCPLAFHAARKVDLHHIQCRLQIKEIKELTGRTSQNSSFCQEKLEFCGDLRLKKGATLVV